MKVPYQANYFRSSVGKLSRVMHLQVIELVPDYSKAREEFNGVIVEAAITDSLGAWFVSLRYSYDDGKSWHNNGGTVSFPSNSEAYTYAWRQSRSLFKQTCSRKFAASLAPAIIGS